MRIVQILFCEKKQAFALRLLTEIVKKKEFFFSSL